MQQRKKKQKSEIPKLIEEEIIQYEPREPYFIRTRREMDGKMKIIQESLEVGRTYFVLTADHVSFKVPVEKEKRLLHYCTLNNPGCRLLVADKRYQETGIYKAKNSPWIYCRRPINVSGQAVANSCQFPEIIKTGSVFEWKIEWLRRCTNCGNTIPGKGALNNHHCSKCINKKIHCKKSIINA